MHDMERSRRKRDFTPVMDIICMERNVWSRVNTKD